MVRYFFHLSYIGTKYRGSQIFPDFPTETIQGTVEAALSSINAASVSRTSFASRTDKGVHALMNTFHVDFEHKKIGEVYQPNVIKKLINSYLNENKHEILVTHVSVVPEKFHARYHAKWRSYLYRLAILRPELRVQFPNTKDCEEFLPISLLNRCHVVPSNLNINVVKDVLDMYCGCHDFSAFTKYTLRDPWKITKRVIEEFRFYELPSCSYIDDSRYSNINMWEFYVKSASFLYHQVRKLVGTALFAGFGVISLSEIEAILKYPTPEKFSRTYIAPPCGLYLANIHYDTEGFSSKEPVNLYKEPNEET